MIKVLIVEDSRVAQEFLVHILTSDPKIEVVGVVSNGIEAIEAAKEKKPNVITMDIHMPRMNGFDATRVIMENVPTPIVIISASTSISETDFTFRAMQAGALAAVHRPPGIGNPEYEKSIDEIIRTVKLLSEIKVIRRTSRKQKEPLQASTPIPTLPAVNKIKVVAIGASTGGPPVLNNILSLFPNDFNVPVMIVQHMAPGFINSFMDWLNKESQLPLHIGRHGETPLPGHGYLAPDGFHMGLGRDKRITLNKKAPQDLLCPSVSFLFRSVAEVLGPNAAGVLLTGMGKDGAEELKLMKDIGALTFAQDEASSVVHGMPGEAIKLGGATYTLPPEAIARMLVRVINKK